MYVYSKDGEREGEIDDPDGLVLTIAASEFDGATYLATGGADSTVTVYKVTQHGVHRWWREEESSQGAITAMCFGRGSCSDLLFTGGRGAMVCVWSLSTGEMLGVLNLHTQRISSIAVSRDGRYVGFGRTDEG